MEVLDQLEHESIYIFREAFAQFGRTALLFSGGKDSILMAHLAKRAFAPDPIPFPFLHIDTGHNFPETLEFRDRLIRSLDVTLLIGHVQESIDQGKVAEEQGYYASRNRLQSVTLLDTIAKHGLNAVFGGGRRDEEKARAKERIFSIRNARGQWDPGAQRPELWRLLNGYLRPGEQMRVFPLSNWTELDVWRYLHRERIELPSLYFAHERECVRRKDGTWLAFSPFMKTDPADPKEVRKVRFRTIGDMTCTGAQLSEATSFEEIIHEILHSHVTERGTRADDMKSENAMEDRKKEGYF